MGDTVQVTLPRDRGMMHPECEIVLRLDSQGRFDAVTLGLDMTLRDVQAALKKKGHPWELAKVFRQAAVVGPWIQLADFPNYLEVPFSLSLDRMMKQKACGKEMRSSPNACLSHAQSTFSVCEGDLLFTGTPAGVTAVQSGQMAELEWGGLLSFKVLFE